MQARTLSFLALAVFGFASSSTGQALEQREREITALAERLSRSVVMVHAVTPGPVGVDRRVAVSGVVLSDDGTIATLASAVAGARDITVEVAGVERPAVLLGIDERTNVGILSVDPEGLVPVEPAPRNEVRVGRFAMVVGNPFGLRNSVGVGIVSGVEREVEAIGLKDGKIVSVLCYDLVQTSAPINPGDSGGLLADSRGRMIGMISSTFGRAPSVERIRQMIRDFARSIDVEQVEGFLSALKLTPEQNALVQMFLARFRSYQESIREEGSNRGPVVYEGMPDGIPGASMGAQGINFALPADQVYFAARMVKAHGRVVRLGVKAELPEAALAAHRGLEPGEGLVVKTVAEGSPAALAGIRKYDILLEMGGRKLGHLRDLRRALVSAPVSGPVMVKLLDVDGRRVDAELRFGD